MKPIRWTTHAIENLAAREIDRAEVEATLAAPDFVQPGLHPRRLLLRVYQDAILHQQMLLCVVIEETIEETVVVTVYKTSQIARYLRGFRS